MKFLGYNNALCLSPHPDDIEYSMSGTILKYYETKFDVLCLSMGGKFDTTTSESRINENINFWENIKNVEYIFNHKIGGEFQDEGRLINLIENNIDIKQYDVIFIPPSEDIHFFHVFINKVGNSLGRVKSIDIIEYFTPSTNRMWSSNTVIDISNVYKDKKNRLKSFISQLKHEYFSDFCIDSFHTDLFYNKKGVYWLEKFKIITIIKN